MNAPLFTCWYRPTPATEWERIATAFTLHEAFRFLIEQTHDRGKGQRFVTRGERTPDEVLDALDRLYRPQTAQRDTGSKIPQTPATPLAP